MRRWTKVEPRATGLRTMTAFGLAVLVLAAVGCDVGGGDAEAAVLDQFAADWNTGDPDVAFDVFEPDGSVVFIGYPQLVGEAEMIPELGRHLGRWTMERTGEAVDAGEGGVEFDVVFINDDWRSERTFVVTLDGETPHMVEDFRADSPARRD